MKTYETLKQPCSHCPFQAAKHGTEHEHGYYDPERADVVKQLRALKDRHRPGDILVASDADREGEAIAWHIFSELKVPEDKVRRVLFNEITAKAIQSALKSPVRLNENKYNSQQARRILAPTNTRRTA